MESVEVDIGKKSTIGVSSSDEFELSGPFFPNDCPFSKRLYSPDDIVIRNP